MRKKWGKVLRFILLLLVQLALYICFFSLIAKQGPEPYAPRFRP